MAGITELMKPGDALINANSCFPDLPWLQREFDILYFLDFCAGLESLIIHNTIFSIGAYPGAEKNPVAGILRGNNVLQVFTPTVADDSELMKSISTVHEHKRAKQLMSLLPNYIQGDDEGVQVAMFAAALSMPMDIVYEDWLQMPLVHSAHELPIYMRLPDIQEEQRAMHLLQNTLAEKYADFRNTLFELRESVDGAEIIRIPPIALQALNDANDFEHLGEVVMDLRHRYSKVREQFAELDEMMRSGDVLPKQKLKEKAKMSKSISKLFTTDELDGITTTTSFAARINEIPNIGGILKDGADPSDISWTKIGGFLIEKAESAYWKFRLSPLHSTKRKYLNLTKNKISEIIKRHFGYGITQRDILIVDKYWKEVQNLQSSIKTGHQTV